MPALWDRMKGQAASAMREKLSDTMVVDATNVGVYCNAAFSKMIDQDVDMLSLFPNVAPPFDQMFLEFDIKDTDVGRIHWGVWVVSYKVSEVLDGTLDETRYVSSNVTLQMKKILLADPVLQKAAWMVSLLPYTAPGMLGGDNPALTNALGMTFYPVLNDGTLIVHPETGVAISKILILPDTPKHTAATHEKFLNALGWPALMTLCFMHCKNVTVEKRSASRVLNKIAKVDKRPNDFHVLRLEPLKRLIKAEGGEACGARKALHIARGHFAKYDERLLFGKYKGTFWIPAHVRGTADRVVEKEYEVKV